MLPEKIPQLDVSIGPRAGAGQLLKASTYEFRYMTADKVQPSVALLMPAATRLTWTDGDLFPPMDQNLPEGELFMRIRALFKTAPFQPGNRAVNRAIDRAFTAQPSYPPIAPLPAQQRSAPPPSGTPARCRPCFRC